MMIIGGALVVAMKEGGSPIIEIGGFKLPLPIIGGGIALLGFLVFIAGLAASPPQKAAPPVIISPQRPTAPAAAPEVLAICPECGAHVSSKSKFCPECGEDLRPKRKAKSREVEEKIEVPKPTKSESKKTGFCMYCGTELPKGSNFCLECGKEVKKVR